MIFSSRVPSNLTPNPLARALDEARAAGRRIIDLTQSNPTRAGFDYAADLLSPLADSRGLTYLPEALGALSARTAVAADYRRRGVSIDPKHIVLTSSTSEAYSMLFKVLCEPGDEVLVPRPSYPLFDHLTALDAVVAVPYDLEYQVGWSVDVESLERGLSPRTRALLVVTPNNPTGSFIKHNELDRVSAACAERAVAIIADEVFADYELVPGAATRSGLVLADRNVLMFSLGGLSKSAGMPQVKLAWIGIGGPPVDVADALARLELVCDTYLSVSTPVQVAAGELLLRGTDIRRQIQSRVVANYQSVAKWVAAMPACRLLQAEGGWSAVVSVPSLGTEEELVVSLLQTEGVLVHPGYFFDFQRESFLVVSLLVPEAEFEEGLDLMLHHFECRSWRG